MPEKLPSSGLLGENELARFARKGHFIYESGDHGDTWLALELLFEDPKRLSSVGARLAQKLVSFRPDFVCAPLIGGALVGQWVAREMGVRFVYAEPMAAIAGGGRRYVIPEGMRRALFGMRIVVVDDVINAGSAALACVHEIDVLGGRVEALAGLIVREGAVSALRERLGIPVESLVLLPWKVWPASACPLCQAHQKVEGSGG